MAGAIGRTLANLFGKVATSGFGRVLGKVAGNKVVQIAAPAILGEGASQVLKRTVFKKEGGRISR